MDRAAIVASCLAALCATLEAAGLGVVPDVASEDVLRRVNDFREQQRRDKVAPEAHLHAAAQEFAQFLAAHDALTHEADGRVPPERAQAHGYALCVVSENLGYQQRVPPLSSGELSALLVEGWKSSPPHRHNMVDPDVTDTGIGLAQSTRTGRWYAVQMFGRPRSAAIHFRISNETRTSVRYRVGDKAFELAPRVSNTHEQCRPLSLTVAGVGDTPIEPRDGERFALVQDASGGTRLERR